MEASHAGRKVKAFPLVLAAVVTTVGPGASSSGVRVGGQAGVEWGRERVKTGTEECRGAQERV